MRFRVLRWIRSDTATGTRQFREVIVQTRRLTIGRASDQHLQVADAKVFPNHAVIRAGRGREGAVVIEALTPTGVAVNGRNRLVCTLNPGDEVRVGPAIIVVEQSQKGSPFTIRFRMAEQEGNRLDRLHVLSLSDSGLSKRFWSLMLASGVAAIFLLVPMAAALYQPLRPLLRASNVVPNDALWSPGPLHASHQFIGSDCNACHTSPFAPIENVQCTNCHTKVEHHVRATSPDIALFDQRRCGECHVEHAETPSVVSRDQRLCSDCHDKLKTLSPRTELLNVADFGRDHPEFRVSMLQSREGPKGLDWTTVRLDVLPDQPRVENSHLRFSHTQHLARKGIKGPNGDEVLQCRNCHEGDSSGRLMLPIQMEKNCSRCHSLRYDEKDPASIVPHGDIEGVYQTLLSHFSRQFLEGDIGSTRRAAISVRRPGGQPGMVLTRDEQYRARDWAEQQSLSAARDLFEKRVCVDCHEVTKLPARIGIEQWKVEPVKLTQTWMPRARFNHEAHKTTECITCHTGATVSKRSNDVLMPNIDVCRTCHSGAEDRKKLPSDCLMCHQFHLPDRGLFDQQAASESEANPRSGVIKRMRALQ